MLVIAPDGERIGELGLEEALYLADELGLDLVEVAPESNPPVCRILDYGKLRYEQSRKEREARKKRPKEAKIIQLRPVIEDGDYKTKLRAITRILESGHPVTVQVRLRGRENATPQLGVDLCNRVIRDLEGVGEKTGDVTRESRMVSVRVAPVRQAKAETKTEAGTGATSEITAPESLPADPCDGAEEAA